MSIESKKAADDAAQYLSEPDEVEARDALWNGEVLQIVLMIALAILQFVAIFWFLARSRMYTIYPGSEGVTFDDYRGQPELVEQARHIVTLLKGVRRFEEMGGFFGGMGSMGLLSTMLVEMSGFSLDYGLRAKLARLRHMVRSLPSRLLRRRVPPMSRPHKRVLTIGATNRMSALDPALLRPGRFDKEIRIDAPTMDGRRDILAYYLSMMAHDDTIDVDGGLRLHAAVGKPIEAESAGRDSRCEASGLNSGPLRSQRGI